MAATSYTPNLGLCAWKATDRPKRADFVNDNNIIDETLGAHIANSALHVSAEEKSRYAEPYKVVTYVGDGAQSKTISLDNSYSFAIVFQKYYPAVEIDSSSNVISHFAIVGRTFGSGANLTLKTSSLVVTQDAQATDKVKNNFNENEGQYVVILFK